jgi:Alpha-acetolactate decarboxylase
VRGNCITGRSSEALGFEIIQDKAGAQVPQLSVDIPASLKAALDRGAAQCELSTSAVVIKPLSRYLEHPIHTVFQVSTSDALVAGVYDREVSVQAIPEHGNFGLGTFADLDGEMVILDGQVYQVQGPGRVSEAAADAGAAAPRAPTSARSTTPSMRRRSVRPA